MHNHIKTTLTLGLIVAICAVGAWLERIDAKKLSDYVARHCVSSTSIDRYVSQGLDGFVCFSQNTDTKRISKTILVIDGI